MADPNPLRGGRRRAPARRRDRASISACSKREARELNPGLRLARDARPAVGADQGRREPRRPHGARRRQQPVDHRRSGARRRPRVARARLRDPDRHRHRAGRTIRSSPCARSRRRASRCASSSTGTRETPREARVLAGGGALIVTAGARNRAWPADVEHVALPDARRSRRPARDDARARAARLNELHVEAGAQLNGALLEAGLVDEILRYLAPSAARRSGARHRSSVATPRAALDERVAARVRVGRARRRRPAHRARACCARDAD